MSEQFIGRGWAFPLRTDATGGIALVSREREIEEAIRLILGTSPGERRCGPSSAAASTTTCSPRPTATTAGAIAYEVRASLAPLGAAHRRRGRRRSPSTGSSPALLYIDIRYAIKATNDRRNLVFPFYVIPGEEELTMALPAPNLDDRRFQDLVDDAKRLVQQRCPEWTDHNVSDPGVTLIETFAWMTDQLLYRLNRVPDRHYIKFLELIGVTPVPGHGARGRRSRSGCPRRSRDVVTIPAGTEVATVRTGHAEAVVFTTTEDLPIVACVARAARAR